MPLCFEDPFPNGKFLRNLQDAQEHHHSPEKMTSDALSNRTAHPNFTLCLELHSDASLCYSLAIYFSASPKLSSLTAFLSSYAQCLAHGSHSTNLKKGRSSHAKEIMCELGLERLLENKVIFRIKFGSWLRP